MMRAVSITLKIPDNTAYTALVALRKLGVDVERIERSRIHFVDDENNAESLLRRMEADETVFNPNTQRIRLLDEMIPGAGEVWIEPLCHPERVIPSGVEGRRGTQQPIVAWRLVAADGNPAEPGVLDAAIERLLCNPAIERAVTRHHGGDGDNPRASE
jgi:phosphoribosylformylglycinamidine (FGAM) synthase PurS component